MSFKEFFEIIILVCHTVLVCTERSRSIEVNKGSYCQNSSENLWSGICNTYFSFIPKVLGLNKKHINA